MANAAAKALIESINKAAAEKQETSVWEGEIPVGKHVRQGDVELTCGEVTWDTNAGPNRNGAWKATGKSKVPHGDVLAEGESVQIAVGEGNGARHIMTGGKGVRVYAPVETDNPLRGPIVVVDKGCNGLLTHPEHRHFKIPAGEYSVTFQQDHLAAERQRLAD